MRAWLELTTDLVLMMEGFFRCVKKEEKKKSEDVGEGVQWEKATARLLSWILDVVWEVV